GGSPSARYTGSITPCDSHVPGAGSTTNRPDPGWHRRRIARWTARSPARSTMTSTRGAPRREREIPALSPIPCSPTQQPEHVARHLLVELLPPGPSAEPDGVVGELRPVAEVAVRAPIIDQRDELVGNPAVDRVVHRHDGEHLLPAELLEPDVPVEPGVQHRLAPEHLETARTPN